MFRVGSGQGKEIAPNNSKGLLLGLIISLGMRREHKWARPACALEFSGLQVYMS